MPHRQERTQSTRQQNCAARGAQAAPGPRSHRALPGIAWDRRSLTPRPTTGRS